MSREPRKTVVAAVSLSFAAVLLAGCSSGDSSPEESVRKKGDGKNTTATGRSSQPPLDKEPLSKAALKKALLGKGDVKGVDVEPVPGDETTARLAHSGAGAKPAACSPLGHMAAYTSTPVPKSHGAVTVSGEDGLVTSVGLMGHQARDATEIVADVRAAVKKCTGGFRDEVGAYRDIIALPDPVEGDEGASYSLKTTMDGQRMSLTFAVIRSGSTLAVFFGTNLVEPDKTKPSREVIRAQLAKLADSASAASG